MPKNSTMSVVASVRAPIAPTIGRCTGAERAALVVENSAKRAAPFDVPIEIVPKPVFSMYPPDRSAAGLIL